jgi:hypothetical protein
MCRPCRLRCLSRPITWCLPTSRQRRPAMRLLSVNQAKTMILLDDIAVQGGL